MAINSMKIRNSLGLTPVVQPTVNVTAGDIYYDSTANMVVYYNGTTWLNLSSLTGTETLTNKTISGGSLSGTISGSPTFSGAVTLTAAGTALTVSNTASIGTLNLTNTLTVNSGSNSLATIFNSTGSFGVYSEWQNSGVNIGFIGSAKAIASGNLADFMVASTGSGNLVLGNGSNTVATLFSNHMTVNYDLTPTSDGNSNLGATGKAFAQLFAYYVADTNGFLALRMDSRRQLYDTAGANIMLDFSSSVLNASTHRITNVVDPVSAQDAATKNYVDNSASPSGGTVVRVAAYTGVNVTVASPGASIGGITLSNGDLVLLFSQTASAENGVYVFNGAASPLTRKTDWSTTAQFSPGRLVIVDQGVERATYYLESAVPTVGTSPVTFKLNDQFLYNGTVIYAETSIQPGNAGSFDLGSSGQYWNNVWAQKFQSQSQIQLIPNYNSGATNMKLGVSITTPSGATSFVSLTGNDDLSLIANFGFLRLETANATGSNNSQNIAMTTGTVVSGTRGSITMTANTVNMTTGGSQALLVDSSQNATFSGKIFASTGTQLAYNGPKNYIAYNNFENNATTGWSLGTVGTLTNGLPTGTPTFGSGASGSLSIAIVSSGQLQGAYSLSYVSSGATTQGNMVASQTYSVDAEDRGRVLQIKFAYSVASGAANTNFSGTSSNSYAWAIYDVTNSSWLTSTGNFNLIQNSGVGTCTGTCQTNATTANVRLVIYNANATAGAATVYLDDLFVGPQVTQSGPAMGDWSTTLPFTFSPGWGTVTNAQMYYRRVGDSLEVNGSFQTGTQTSATAYIQLPAGMTIDFTKLTGTATQVLGQGNRFTAGSGGWGGSGSAPLYAYFSDLTTNNQLFASETEGTQTFTKVGVSTGIDGNNNSYQTVWFKVPIAGWSSNSIQSSDTDTRIVAANISGATNTLSTSVVTTLTFPTVTNDTNAAYSTGTGLYTVPVSGYYFVSSSVNVGSGSLSNNVNIPLNIARNGSTIVSAFNQCAAGTQGQVSIVVSGLVKVSAGDTLSITAGGTAAWSGSASIGSGSIASFLRLSGPAVVTATESVKASYYLSANATPGAGVQINYDTKLVDSHNAVTTGAGAWKFTAPVSGFYQISTVISWNANNAGGAAFLYKNGVNQGSFTGIWGTTGNGQNGIVTGSNGIQLNAGDFVDIRTSGAATLNGSGLPYNTIMSIYRVGN